MSSQLLTLHPVSESAAPAVFAGSMATERRFREFFTTQISNTLTRKAYFKAARHFSVWCQARKIGDVRRVQPIHVGLLEGFGEGWPRCTFDAYPF